MTQKYSFSTIISTQIPQKIFQWLESENYNRIITKTVNRLKIEIVQVSLKNLEAQKFQFCLNKPKIL
jgi:hypothetical protein